MPAKGTRAKVKKVVLAYSGGLDTSIILKWLQETYGCEVVTFTADLGQGEEVEPARRKAELLGIRPENIFIEDLREEFGDIVNRAGYASPIRTPRGRDIMAACGQLKSESVKQRASDRIAELRSQELSRMPH